ncbi:MAG: transporter substrate-binding domain-containing protein [bacterium]
MVHLRTFITPFRIFLLLLLFSSCFWLIGCQIQTHSKVYIASGHPEWAPIMWQNDNKIVGTGPDLVGKIFGDLGVQVDSQYVGLWDEVQNKTKSGDVDVLVAAYKTSEREEYMEYSIPYTVDPIVVFVKKGKEFPYSAWENLIGKTGVVTVGDSYGQGFDDYLKTNLKVQRVSDVAAAFASLDQEKSDYFLYSLYSGQKELAMRGFQDRIVPLTTYVASEKFYITISKRSPLITLMPKVNELITKYQNDGTIDSLLRKYQEDLVAKSLNQLVG